MRDRFPGMELEYKAPPKARCSCGETLLRTTEWRCPKCAVPRSELLEEIRDLQMENNHLAEQRRCECSADDACRFARERDEARAELNKLKQDIGR